MALHQLPQVGLSLLAHVYRYSLCPPPQFHAAANSDEEARNKKNTKNGRSTEDLKSE